MRKKKKNINTNLPVRARFQNIRLTCTSSRQTERIVEVLFTGLHDTNEKKRVFIEMGESNDSKPLILLVVVVASLFIFV